MIPSRQKTIFLFMLLLSCTPSNAGEEQEYQNIIKEGDVESLKIILENANSSKLEHLASIALTVPDPRYEVLKLIKDEGSKLISDLQIASTAGDLDSIKQLILKGTNVDEGIDPSGYESMTALMLAARKGHIQIIEYLIEEKGANIEANNRYEGTALIQAAENNQLEAVKVLINHNADVNATADFYTPLMKAAWNGHNEVVKTLIKNGASVNAKRHDNQTTLILAAKQRHLHVIKILLKNGADIEAKDAGGNSALSYSSLYGYTDCVKELLEKGVNVNSKNMNDWTALHFATKNGHREIMELLLYYNIDIDVKTKEGVSAFDIAKQAGNNEIVDLLEKTISSKKATKGEYRPRTQ